MQTSQTAPISVFPRSFAKLEKSSAGAIDSKKSSTTKSTDIAKQPENASHVTTNKFTELSKSYANEINAAHDTLVSYTAQCAEQVIKVANVARETGILLLSVKERIGHGGFLKWQSENLRFSHDKASQLMTLARSHRDGPITEFGVAVRLLQKASVASGHLALPGREHAQVAKNYDFFSTLTARAMGFMECTNRQLEAEPLEEWPIERLNAVDEQIRPIFELRERIQSVINGRTVEIEE
jgi:hypothetical protein